MIKLRSDSWSTLLVNNVDAMLSRKEKKRFIITLLDNTKAGNENMLMIVFVHSESIVLVLLMMPC